MNQPERYPQQEVTFASSSVDDSTDDQRVAASSHSADVSRLQKALRLGLFGKMERESAPTLLDKFLSSQDPVEQILLYFGEGALRRTAQDSVKWIVEQLQVEIAKIDMCVKDQLNQIIHQSEFQRLEASWRGLYHLAECRENWNSAPISLKVLSVTWAELRDDLEDASEFDQSAVFKKIYEEEFGMPGGLPFSTILLDFAIHPAPSKQHPFDDMEILGKLAKVAEASFCPFIANADPSMFGENHFRELLPPRTNQRIEQDHYEKLHNEISFLAWKNFRRSEASRFVSLTMPRILMRRPYREASGRLLGFGFNEDISRPGDYLWGGAAFGAGEVIMRAFASGYWLADIRGAQRGDISGGVVRGPTYDAFMNEPRDASIKPITEVVIGDDFERSLSRLGFLPLCACKDVPVAAFYSSATVQKPEIYTNSEATVNARMSSMLNYMLCASRFAHYIKVMTRDRIGRWDRPEELERYLENWLAGYICSAEAEGRIRAEKPLRDAQIMIQPVPGKPGELKSVLHIAPHFGFEDVVATVRLKDERLVKNPSIR